MDHDHLLSSSVAILVLTNMIVETVQKYPEQRQLFHNSSQWKMPRSWKILLPTCPPKGSEYCSD